MLLLVSIRYIMRIYIRINKDMFNDNNRIDNN